MKTLRLTINPEDLDLRFLASRHRDGCIDSSRRRALSPSLPKPSMGSGANALDAEAVEKIFRGETTPCLGSLDRPRLRPAHALQRRRVRLAECFDGFGKRAYLRLLARPPDSVAAKSRGSPTHRDCGATAGRCAHAVASGREGPDFRGWSPHRRAQRQSLRPHQPHPRRPCAGRPRWPDRRRPRCRRDRARARVDRSRRLAGAGGPLSPRNHLARADSRGLRIGSGMEVARNRAMRETHARIDAVARAGNPPLCPSCPP